LRPGDRVAIVSPAGPANAVRVEHGMELLRSWGLIPELGKHALAQHGYLAGSDADRLADLTAAVRDPGIRAVLATRGGYGAQRILDGVPWDLLVDDPKLLVGFSDITALHLAVWQAAGLASLYGPGMAWDSERLGAAGLESARSAMMTDAAVTIAVDPAEPGASVVVPGVARGPLLGGNLSLVAASVGAGLPSLAGAVLLLEEVGEAPYRIDRMLTQLRRSGALDGIVGVALGQLTSCGTVDSVLADRLGDLGVPVLGGLPIGHGPGQLTVPLGTPATLDVGGATLVVEAAVRPV
jgi:muramoyltetrapeptide carboxypeptidase